MCLSFNRHWEHHPTNEPRGFNLWRAMGGVAQILAHETVVTRTHAPRERNAIKKKGFGGISGSRGVTLSVTLLHFHTYLTTSPQMPASAPMLEVGKAGRLKLREVARVLTLARQEIDRVVAAATMPTTVAVAVVDPLPAVGIPAAAAAPAMVAALCTQVPGQGAACVFQPLPLRLPARDEHTGSEGRRGQHWSPLVTMRTLTSGRIHAQERSGSPRLFLPGVVERLQQTGCHSNRNRRKWATRFPRVLVRLSFSAAAHTIRRNWEA